MEMIHASVLKVLQKGEKPIEEEKKLKAST
jgi:hypothetical protein